MLAVSVTIRVQGSSDDDTNPEMNEDSTEDVAIQLENLELWVGTLDEQSND